jgi:hypothetical protein
MDMKKSAIAWMQGLLARWQGDGAKKAATGRGGAIKKRQDAVAMSINKKGKNHTRKRADKAQPVPL